MAPLKGVDVGEKILGLFSKILKFSKFFWKLLCFKNIWKIPRVSYKNTLLLYKNTGILRVSVQITQSNPVYLQDTHNIFVRYYNVFVIFLELSIF